MYPRGSRKHIFLVHLLLCFFSKKSHTHTHTPTHPQNYLGFVARMVLCLGSDATVLTHTNPHPSNISSMLRLKYSSEKGSVDFINIAMGFGSFWMMGERGSLSVMAKHRGRGDGRVLGRWLCVCVCVCVWVGVYVSVCVWMGE
jgi:hypothetical protein